MMSSARTKMMLYMEIYVGPGPQNDGISCLTGNVVND